MNFPEVTHRLRAIKKEIHELRLLPIVDIQEKIHILKNINILLREQNQLLLIRQKIISNRGNRDILSSGVRHFFPVI